MSNANTVKIEVKIKDIEELEETADKCFAITEAHPYVSKITIRVDGSSFPYKLRRILRFVHKRMLRHPRKTGDKSCFQACNDEK